MLQKCIVNLEEESSVQQPSSCYALDFVVNVLGAQKGFVSVGARVTTLNMKSLLNDHLNNS